MPLLLLLLLLSSVDVAFKRAGFRRLRPYELCDLALLLSLVSSLSSELVESISIGCCFAALRAPRPLAVVADEEEEEDEEGALDLFE